MNENNMSANNADCIYGDSFLACYRACCIAFKKGNWSEWILKGRNVIEYFCKYYICIYFIKNLFNKITRKANETAANIRGNVSNALNNIEGDGYVSDGLRILISVVIGALLLAGLYALFNGVIMPSTESRVTDLFNYSGT